MNLLSKLFASRDATTRIATLDALEARIKSLRAPETSCNVYLDELTAEIAKVEAALKAQKAPDSSVPRKLTQLRVEWNALYEYRVNVLAGSASDAAVAAEINSPDTRKIYADLLKSLAAETEGKIEAIMATLKKTSAETGVRFDNSNAVGELTNLLVEVRDGIVRATEKPVFNKDDTAVLNSLIRGWRPVLPAPAPAPEGMIQTAERLRRERGGLPGTGEESEPVRHGPASLLDPKGEYRRQQDLCHAPE